MTEVMDGLVAFGVLALLCMYCAQKWAYKTYVEARRIREIVETHCCPTAPVAPPDDEPEEIG